MWDDDKQQRLDDLQRKASEGSLSADDQRALERLFLDLERAEWASLRPAMSQLRQEQEQLQDDLGRLRTQNAVLLALADRYADLLARATVQLSGLARERAALRTEYERALQDVARS